MALPSWGDREPIVKMRTRPGQSGRREEMVVVMSWHSGWAWRQADHTLPGYGKFKKRRCT